MQIAVTFKGRKLANSFVSLSLQREAFDIAFIYRSYRKVHDASLYLGFDESTRMHKDYSAYEQHKWHISTGIRMHEM